MVRVGLVLVAACSASPDAGVGPNTGDRALDATFGDAGTVSLDLGDYDGFTSSARLDPATGEIEVAIGGQSATSAVSETTGQIVLLRFTPEGTPDGQIVIARPDVQGVELDPAGNVMVWDSSALARLHADGSADPTFQDIALTPFEDGRPVFAPDGTLYLVTANSGTIERYDSTGTLDPTFGSGGQVAMLGPGGSQIDGLTVGVDGALIAGFDSTTDAKLRIAALHADGTLDPTVGDNGIIALGFPNAQSTSGRGIWIDPSGKLVVASYLYSNPPPPVQWLLQRYNRDGSLDVTFDYYPTTGFASALVFQPDSTILAGGFVRTTISSDPLFWLARYTAAGTLDPTFGQAGQLQTPIDGHGGGIDQLLVGVDGTILGVGTQTIGGEATTITHVFLAMARYLPQP